MKKAFTLIEIVIVFALILLTSYLILPSILDDTKQARFVQLLQSQYKEIEYVFSVAILSENENKSNEKILKNKSAENLFTFFTPYLRLKKEIKPEEYKIKFLNGENNRKNDIYSFEKFMQTEAGKIISFKKTDNNYKIPNLVGIMFLDVNGTNLPNTWGKDIYAINIFEDRIEPVGLNIENDIKKENCSKRGSGIYCAAYYLTGGQFE